MNVTVLGLGRMGSALVTRAAAGGHDVVVWNRTPGRASDALAAGAREAATVAEAVESAEVVITMLANDDAVRETARQLRSTLAPTAVYVDCSTISPALASELAGSIERFASMPVFGGPDAVRSGQAVFIIGGPDDVVTFVEPVLESLSSSIVRLARPELALAAKVTGNFLLMTELAALAEGVAVARAGGLDDDHLRLLFAGNPLLPPALANRFEAVLTGSIDGWFAAALGGKDVGLALDVAESAGVRLPVGEAVRSVYQAAVDAGLGEADIAAVGRMYPSS